MDELAEQPTRRRILEEIRRAPGSSARDLQRRLGLAWGQATYHLERLVRANLVRRERGGARDFYFPTHLLEADRRLLQALQSPTQRAILLHLAARPDRTFSQIHAAGVVGKSTVSFHLSLLVARGLVESAYREGQRRYRPTGPDRVRALVEEYRETFRDRLVDRFVDALGGMVGGVGSSARARGTEGRPAEP